MAIKTNSKKVTITLNRTTVAMLRAKKKDLETWDDLMLRLGEGRRYGIDCIFCGAFLTAENNDKSPRMLAKENGWQAVYGGKDSDNRIARKEELGYVCSDCWKRREKEMDEIEERARKK